nr:IclR family transcriptional regulator [uncultured Bacillus sp.]
MKTNTQSREYSSLRNSLRLLNLFSTSEPELNLSEISGRLGVALSTAFRLANTLMQEGLIIRDPHTKYYRPAASILAMGNTILSKIALCRIARPVLEKLTADTRESSHIAVFRDDQAMYLLKVENLYPVHLLSHAGKSNPSYCTSTGQVLLAYQSETVIKQLIERGLKAFTTKTCTNPTELLNTLSKIRKQGYAISIEELHKGVTSIAAPVRHPLGKVIASVSIAGPISRVNRNTLPKLTKLVQQAADDISKELRLIKENGKQK